MDCGLRESCTCWPKDRAIAGALSRCARALMKELLSRSVASLRKLNFLGWSYITEKRDTYVVNLRAAMMRQDRLMTREVTIHVMDQVQPNQYCVR
jgi:hypothetical protein